MTESTVPIGRTIQLFLVDGSPGGLVIASIHGWTGSVLVGTQATFARLRARPEADRTGVYILYGPDPDDNLRAKAYIGEADSVRDRINSSAEKHDFWETAAVITTSDEALTKGHVRYLEARIIEITVAAGRVSLSNVQASSAERRRLPEADRANMEAFLANLGVILPMVGLELLKPQAKALQSQAAVAVTGQTRFEIRHRSGISATAVEEGSEFIVLADSQALKDAGYKTNSYSKLRRELIEQGVLVVAADGERYEFAKPYAFKSPSAAGSVVIDRNTNGRTRWHVIGSGQSYGDWQQDTIQLEQPL